MKKVLLIFIIFIMIASTLIGCSGNKNTFVFKGQSKSWTMVYTMYVTNNTHTKSDFNLKYKGTDIKKVGEVNYTINGPTEGQSNQLTLNSQGESSGNIQLIGGMPESKLGINVKIVWNNKQELLYLTKEN